ncbi:MAG: hypothetical protein Q9227_007521 [Pyrenula ochraceoflavens]
MDEEPILEHGRPLPRGFVLVKKGNVYITRQARKLTLSDGYQLFRVHDSKDRLIGLACPSHIYDAVLLLEAATREDRAASVLRKDALDNTRARDALTRLFPSISVAEIDPIVKRAFEKGSGCIGRAGQIGLEERVGLAVWSHVRHKYTEYDTLLRKGMDREAARLKVRGDIQRIYKKWGGDEKLLKARKGPGAKSRGRGGKAGSKRVKRVGKAQIKKATNPAMTAKVKTSGKRNAKGSGRTSSRRKR